MREDELRTVNLFKALANPVRYQILKLLANEEYSVTEMTNILRRDISNISRNLTVLRQNQLVQYRTEQNQVYYRIKKKEVLSLLEHANEIVKRKK